MACGTLKSSGKIPTKLIEREHRIPSAVERVEYTIERDLRMLLRYKKCGMDNIPRRNIPKFHSLWPMGFRIIPPCSLIVFVKME